MVPLLLPLLTPLVTALVDLIPDPTERERKRVELETAMLKQAHEQTMAQVSLNQAEAQHASIFVAGWRPFIGWTCGVALAWAFILGPIAAWIAQMVSPDTPLPSIQFDHLFELVLAMLGLGGLRTFEKLKGVPPSLPARH